MVWKTTTCTVSLLENIFQQTWWWWGGRLLGVITFVQQWFTFINKLKFHSVAPCHKLFNTGKAFPSHRWRKRVETSKSFGENRKYSGWTKFGPKPRHREAPEVLEYKFKNNHLLRYRLRLHTFLDRISSELCAFSSLIWDPRSWIKIICSRYIAVFKGYSLVLESLFSVNNV